MNAITRKVLKNIRQRDEIGKFSPEELVEKHKKRIGTAKSHLDGQGRLVDVVQVDRCRVHGL